MFYFSRYNIQPLKMFLKMKVSQSIPSAAYAEQAEWVDRSLEQEFFKR